MTDPTYTHATLVIDRSGSMARVKDDAQGGIDSFLADQRGGPGKFTLTLVHFDSSVEVPIDFIPIADVPGYLLLPRGITALLDAVGTAITTTGERLAALPEDERPANVIVAIVTDGMENASKEYTMDQVKEMITHQRDTYGWRFEFYGADTAAWTGHQLGIPQTVSYTGDGIGTQTAYATMSRSATITRSGGQPS